MCISILDRYIFYCSSELPKAQLQTVGTSALFLAGKMEEVTPPILDRLIEFGDGAVDFDDLIKVEQNVLLTLKWQVNAVTPYTFLLFYLQAPKLISNKTAFPEFNETLLWCAATILDLTRLDPDAYDFDVHTIAAAVLIRILEYVEFQCEIRREINAKSQMEVSSDSIAHIINFTLAFEDSNRLHFCCDNFLTSYVAVFFNEQLLKLRSKMPWSFPGATLNQGCLRETAQLQTNIGEQGSVSMFEDIRLYTERINNARAESDENELSLLKATLNVPTEFFDASRHRQTKKSSTPSQIEPVSPS